MMEEKNTGIKIENVFEEYKKQLKLMEKQYGQEEDLYPWIYMLLLESGKVNNLSMRQVASASWADCVVGREMLRGYAGFPDIAILDKDFCVINVKDEEDINNKISIVRKRFEERKESDENNIIENISQKNMEMDGKTKLSEILYENNIDKIKGCIEVKDMSKTLIDIQTSKSLTINCSADKYVAKYRKGKGKSCYQIKDVNVENVNELKLGEYIEIKYDDLPNEVKSSGKFRKENKISRKFERCINCFIELEVSGVKKKYNLNDTDIRQFFGELIWYGKVLYTNGKVWKYIEVTKCSNEKEIESIVDLRGILYAECVNVHKPEQEWYKCICELQKDKGLEIEIDCKTKLDKDDLMSWLKEKVNF